MGTDANKKSFLPTKIKEKEGKRKEFNNRKKEGNGDATKPCTKAIIDMTFPPDNTKTSE